MKEMISKSGGQREVKELMKKATPGVMPDDVALTLQQRLSEGYQAKKKEHYAQALQEFADISKVFEQTLSPEMKVHLLQEMAMLSFWAGDYRTAEAHAHTILALQKLCPDVEEVAYEILARVAIARYEFNNARQFVGKISPRSFVRKMLECLICIKRRDLNGAEAVIKSIYLECEREGRPVPSSPEFEVYQVFCGLLRGHSKESMANARQLKKKCKKDPMLMLLLAEIFMTAGAYSDALNTAKSVEKHCPENDQVHAIYSHVAYAEEDFSRAENEAKQAVQINPKNHYAQTILMKIDMREGKYGDAEKRGQHILDQSPEYSLGHANLGDLYFIQGKYDLARQEYHHTEELIQSKTKGALLRQARIFFMDEMYEDAAKILETMTSDVHTYYDDAMCDLLLCYEKMGEAEKKRGLLEKMNLRKAFNKRIDQVLNTIEAQGT